MTTLRDPRSWTSFARRSWWALLLLSGIVLWLVGMAGWPNPFVSALVFIGGLALIVADGVLVGRASKG